MWFSSISAAQTRSLGAALAKVLRPGDVLLLYGEMGAGKSEFTRGIARGLGIDGPIASPTFTILQVYTDGSIPLYHFDWYRLESAQELYDMGMEEYLGGDGVAVVEWPERVFEAIPVAYLKISLSPGAAEGERYLEITPVGDFREIKMEDALS